MADRNSSPSASVRRKPSRIALDVIPSGQGWSIKKGESSQAASVYGTKAEAVEAARLLIHRKGGALRIHGRDGRIQESITLGREAAAKISAIEGISLEGEVRRDLEAFDGQSLSPEERRARIGLKYSAGAKAAR